MGGGGDYSRISKHGNLVVEHGGRETVYTKDGRVINEPTHATARDVYVPRGSSVHESRKGNIVVDNRNGSENVYNKNGDQIAHQPPVQLYDPQPTVYVRSNSH